MIKITKQVLQKIKRLVQVLRVSDCFFKPDITLKSTRFGSSYGGWDVPAHLLKSDSIIYAAGIGTDISFDEAIIKKLNVVVHAFDPTPQSLEWLDEQNLPEKFRYYPWGFANYDGEAEFHIPKNPAHISHSMIGSQVTAKESVTVRVRRIKSIMEELGHDRVDLLKMDIEGAEYSVIENLLASPLRPSLLLIEFHHRFKSIGAVATQNTVKALQEIGYKIYNVSPSGEELCFIYPTDL